MLITTCSHCQSRFRVTPQQLNVKQGQVRCGRCRQVFSGFESLERFPDDDTGARLLAARDAAHGGADAPALPPPEPSPNASLPEVEAVDAPASPPPEAPAVTFTTVSTVTPPAPPSTEAPATSPRMVEEPGRPSAPLPARAARMKDLLHEPPKPVKRPRSIGWTLGALLLAVVLTAEVAYALRGPLAQRYPVLRPTLEALCVHARCSVPWSREDSLLKLEDSELLEVPGKPNEIAVGARIRNLATVAQEYPHLELTLTDLSGQPASRRVLRPTDYLGRPAATGDVLRPGTDITIQLRIETPRIKATGYELLLFYP